MTHVVPAAEQRPDDATETPVVSAVIPCLNEARTVGICIEKAQRAFSRLGIAGEVVVADNGSTDGTADIARALGARVVDQPVRGYGAALDAGIRGARGRYVIMGDADDSYDWEAIGGFVDELDKGYDLVMGNRFKGGIEPYAMPWHHYYIGNPVLSWTARLAFRMKIGDFHCGMRAFTAEAYQRIRPQTPGMEYATEMVACAARAGLRIGEIPVRLYKDKRDRPPHLRSFRDGWRHLRFIITYAPDHLYMLPGVSALSVGMLLQALLVRGPFRYHGFNLGIHFLALAGLLLLIGINMLGMGFLAKLILGKRYPLAIGAFYRACLNTFRLERGLVIGAGVFVVGFSMASVVAWIWLHHLGQSMEYTVHPAFVATQLMAAGFNVMVFSFILQLALLEFKVGDSNDPHAQG